MIEQRIKMRLAISSRFALGRRVRHRAVNTALGRSVTCSASHFLIVAVGSNPTWAEAH